MVAAAWHAPNDGEATPAARQAAAQMSANTSNRTAACSMQRHEKQMLRRGSWLTKSPNRKFYCVCIMFMDLLASWRTNAGCIFWPSCSLLLLLLFIIYTTSSIIHDAPGHSSLWSTLNASVFPLKWQRLVVGQEGTKNNCQTKESESTESRK